MIVDNRIKTTKENLLFTRLTPTFQKCDVTATLMIYKFQEAKGHVFILKFVVKSVMSYFAKLCHVLSSISILIYL